MKPTIPNLRRLAASCGCELDYRQDDPVSQITIWTPSGKMFANGQHCLSEVWTAGPKEWRTDAIRELEERFRYWAVEVGLVPCADPQCEHCEEQEEEEDELPVIIWMEG